jgi:peptidoglycan/xylan/chitin deacetylase (PgdA/CDA1 family)/lysophospholipase L1-like esterase
MSMKHTSLRRFAGLGAAVLLGSGSLAVTSPAAAAPRCDGYVALTFDDGPTPGNTGALLKVLRAAGARATMFNTGANVEANPELTRSQQAAGMWIGNHSWDHPHMTTLTPADQASQISRTQDAIKRVTGLTPKLFRPPYLETNDALRAVERQYGLREINADVDSRDWDNTSVDQIVENARKLQPGGVILMHDWPPNTLQAVPRIVTELRARRLCPGQISPSTGRAVAPGPITPVPSQVHTAGRVSTVGTGVAYTWPGVYFEGRFRGTSVGLALDDAVNDYDVQIDGAAPATLVTPGATTHWITGLSRGDHTVRLSKRTESPWNAGQFGGLVPGPGGKILAAPAARHRQIEFVGDSWTAGYGDMSTSRDCSGAGVLTRNSNADQAFSARTGRALNADYQIDAWSGIGMVRNYNGSSPGTDYRTYYDRALQAVDESVWKRPASWRPQAVVIGLGINDFSTPLNPGEKWADEAALAADYVAAYQGFLDKLRQRYGSRTYLVLTYPDLSYRTTALADSIQRIVRERDAQGDHRVRALYYDNTALGLDLLGCDWHPSLHDHEILARTLTGFLRALP